MEENKTYQDAVLHKDLITTSECNWLNLTVKQKPFLSPFIPSNPINFLFVAADNTLDLVTDMSQLSSQSSFSIKTHNNSISNITKGLNSVRL